MLEIVFIEYKYTIFSEVCEMKTSSYLNHVNMLYENEFVNVHCQIKVSFKPSYTCPLCLITTKQKYISNDLAYAEQMAKHYRAKGSVTRCLESALLFNIWKFIRIKVCPKA